MEMPIQIMIILFVAITVGGGMVYFSQDNLANSKEGLDSIIEKNDLSDEEKILEVSSITTNNVVSLAKQCRIDKQQSLEDSICFVLLGGVSTTCLSIFDELRRDDDFDEDDYYCDIASNGNSIKISYNAPLSLVEIT